ncbi:MAG: winged helix-turn-helix transcriptional regulator [Spirochaetes bacterium]|nr:winged helix-turn-helix transcriptional regulator [Spirochaetota bacterium]
MSKKVYADIGVLQLIFQTLSDANRLTIIKYINDSECSVSQIVEETGLSQPLVSHHLKTLRERQILETARNGPFIYYRLKDKKLLKIFDSILEVVGPIDESKLGKPFRCGPMSCR